jgi:Transglutaminase-like superfamily
MTSDFYARQSAFSDPGPHAGLLNQLPARVDELARIVQELCIYDVVAEDFYDHRISRERQEEIHLRSVVPMLDRLLALENRLDAPRPPARRLVGRCHHYALLLTSMLRTHGIAARMRCGFGRYFNPGYFEDHWVCEYFDTQANRWILVDSQLDTVWREKLAIKFDPDDVPRSEFVVAADAWNACRREGADASKFGIEFVKLRGLWYIAGNLVRDLASLNKFEMVPWDTWGAQPEPNAQLGSGELALFDKLAELPRAPDSTFEKMRSVYASDDRLRVPPQVFNAIRQRLEEVPELQTANA